MSETAELDLEKVGDGIGNFGPVLSEECKPAIFCGTPGLLGQALPPAP